MKTKSWLLILVLSIFAGISACSGGGGDSPQPTPQKPSDSTKWDSMVWDQDNWS